MFIVKVFPKNGPEQERTFNHLYEAEEFADDQEHYWQIYKDEVTDDNFVDEGP